MHGSQLPPPGWYPDPTVPGAQRWFDGQAWTAHFSPPPAPQWYGPPPWKGARYGLPAAGPGALAPPIRRLGARLLDALVLLPVLALLLGVTLAIAAPHFGPIFPTIRTRSTTNAPTPGFVWIYVTVIACLVATGLVMLVYETVLTVKWGRTLGKRWVGIRPVRTDGAPLRWGRALARITVYWVSGFLSWIGLLDPLWCLWDAESQCLHDKVVDTLVINDPPHATAPGRAP